MRFKKYNDPWEQRSILANKFNPPCKMIVIMDLLKCLWQYEHTFLRRFPQTMSICSLICIHAWMEQKHLHFQFYQPNWKLLTFFAKLGKQKVKITAAHQIIAMIVLYSFYPYMLYQWILTGEDWIKKDLFYWEELNKMFTNWEHSAFHSIPSPWMSFVSLFYTKTKTKLKKQPKTKKKKKKHTFSGSRFCGSISVFSSPIFSNFTIDAQ